MAQDTDSIPSLALGFASAKNRLENFFSDSEGTSLIY